MISDFGLSKILDDSVMSPPTFIDPQCFINKKYCRDNKSDIYSLGNLFWEISSGYPPFESYSNYLIASKIIAGEREAPVEGSMSTYVDLYQQCWDNDPKKRPEIQEVFEKLKQASLQYQNKFSTEDTENNVNNKSKTEAVEKTYVKCKFMSMFEFDLIILI